MSRPYFFSQPFRYMRWAAHERPAIFFSIVLGCLGPVSLVSIPPVRRYFGDVNPEKVPMTYPIPIGKRQIPQGFDDDSQ